MTISAIVTSHNNEVQRKLFVENLWKQTKKPDEVIILVSQEHDLDGCIECPNLNDWGQQKRADGLDLATCDFLGFFNTDDEYHPQYLEKLIAEAENSDIVACDFHSHLTGGIIYTQPCIGGITSGNFLVRTKLAQIVGYNHRVYEADGMFIEDCMREGARFKPVKEVLYWHY